MIEDLLREQEESLKKQDAEIKKMFNEMFIHYWDKPHTKALLLEAIRSIDERV